MRWELSKLEAVLDMYQPKTLAKKHFKSGPFKVYGANGIIGAHDEFNHEERQVVLGCRGSCGEVHLTEPHSWINGNAMVMRPKDSSQLSQEFLFKALEGGVDTTKAITGSAQPQITRKSLNSLCIPIPPLEEQERIVEVLDEAFAAIDKAKANIERNLTNARELFQSRLNDIFSNPSEDWEVKPLSEVCDINSGSTPKRNQKDFWEEGDVPWFTVKDIRKQGREIRWTLESVTQKALDETPLNVVPEGSVLLCCTASVGEYALTQIPTTFNQQFNGLTPSKSVAPRFLMFWCSTLKKELLSLSGKATVDFVSQTKLKNIRIPIPPIDEQELITSELGALDEMKRGLEAKYQSELDNLEELRQSILEQAFEGKLTKPVAA